MNVNKKPPFKFLIIVTCICVLVPLFIFVMITQLAKGPAIVSPGGTPQHGDTNIAFWLGTMPVAWYGVMIFLGFAVAILLSCLKMWKYYKIPIDPFYWFCLMGIPTAIIGARFWSCCLGDAQWPDFFSFRKGGLAIEGGVILTILLACWWFPFILKKPRYQVRDDLREPVAVRQISSLLYFDIIIPSILIGQVIGRWGNYFNHELYGPAVAPGALQDFLKNFLPYMQSTSDSTWYQPLFLWEGLLNLLGLLLIYIGAEFIPKKKAGDLAAGYILWYGIVRLSLEGLRASQYSFISTYIMSGLWVGIAIIILLANHTVFPKIRNYNIRYVMWAPIYKIFTLSFVNKQKEPAKYEHYLTRYNQYRSHWLRKDIELLYYFGR